MICTFQKLAKQISKLQSGLVYHYALVMLIGWQSFVKFICDFVLSLVNEQISGPTSMKPG